MTKASTKEVARMTLTSKLQMSLPARARDRYRLRAGDQLEIEFRKGEMRMRPIRRRRLTELAGALPAKDAFPGRDALRAKAANALAERYDKSASRAK